MFQDLVHFIVLGDVDFDKNEEDGGYDGRYGRSPDGGTVDAEYEVDSEKGFLVWDHRWISWSAAGCTFVFKLS